MKTLLDILAMEMTLVAVLLWDDEDALRSVG